MVVQKNAEASKQTSEDPVNTSWSSQPPQNAVVSRPTTVIQTRPAITRLVAINTLAAMHRRFSLPGPVQPHSRPISEFRASANKSLDMLRQTVQSAVTREIDQVIKKYLEKFFVPAVNNIRLNLGEESVSEDQVRAVCRAMLDATRLLYSTPHRASSSPYETGESESNNGTELKQNKQQICNNLQNTFQNKRKETEVDSETSVIKRRRIKQEDLVEGVAYSPLTASTIRDPDKWNPDRLNQDTLFIMGSHAHKVLGLGNSRGRLYTRHAGLLRYPADIADKEWIAGHNLVNAVGGKTYIMVLEDIEELAATEPYRHNSLPMLGELTGFKVPPFMLKKIKAYVSKRVLGCDGISPESPAAIDNAEVLKKPTEIKLESDLDYKSTYLDNAKVYTDIPLVKEDTDFADIKVDGIKVEDIDDIKVEGMDIGDIKVKVEDLDVDSIKVEHMDDINIDEIKVEDIKLENDNAFSIYNKSDEEQSQLVDGLLDADIEFLSRNLGNIESDTDARRTIEKLTGANPDTLTLVGDEFDLGTALNTNNYSDSQTTKCITVASTTSGMVHSVPVAHLAPARLSGTLHYYRTPRVNTCAPRLQGMSTPQPQVIRSIPINTKSGTFSTVVSQGTASIIGFSNRTSTAAIIGTSTQYVNVNSKTFPAGNILHNAIVSRNFINRANYTPVTSGVTYSVSSVKPIHTTAPKINCLHDMDSISTTKDMIDNACNSSVMLKKVLTLGSSGAAKSFMMHNTQKVLSTGFASGSTPPPNVTIVSSGSNGLGIPLMGNIHSVHTPMTSTLSATHATLSALLSSNHADNVQTTRK